MILDCCTTGPRVRKLNYKWDISGKNKMIFHFDKKSVFLLLKMNILCFVVCIWIAIHHIMRKINDYQCMKSQSECRQILTRFSTHHFLIISLYVSRDQSYGTAKPLSITLYWKISRSSLLPLSSLLICIKLRFSQHYQIAVLTYYDSNCRFSWKLKWVICILGSTAFDHNLTTTDPL